MSMLERMAEMIWANHGEVRDLETSRLLAEALLDSLIAPSSELLAKLADSELTPQGGVYWDGICHYCGGAKFTWQTMVQAIREGK